MIGQYVLIARAVEALVLHAAPLGTVWPLLGWVPLLILGRAVAQAVGDGLAQAAGARVRRLARAELACHLVALGPVRLAGERSGALSALLVEGIEALESYYGRFLPARRRAMLVPLGLLGAVAVLDGRSALVLAVTAPLIALFMSLIGMGAERLNRRQWAGLARMSAHLIERIRGIAILKLFNATRAEAETLGRIADDYRTATMEVLRVAFLSSLALEFFAALGVAMVAVLIGFRLLEGSFGFGDGLLILLLAPEFYLPLRQLGVHYHARMEAVAAATQLLALLGRPAAPTPAPATPARCPDAAPLIRFEGVRLTHAGGRVALDGLDLDLAPGRITALAGASGAGKSSVAALLLRFAEPDGGRITIDGTPLGAFAPEAWRRRLAWVPQRPHLGAGTLAEALRLGDPAAEDEALWQALARVGADRFVAALPGRLDWRLGEGGVGLSGGQIRLIAMARAALRDAPLLILDEPTASLDRAAEQGIALALPRLAAGRTTLVIAHRRSTLETADTVAVLESGRVVAHGPHADLGRDPAGPYGRLHATAPEGR